MSGRYRVPATGPLMALALLGLALSMMFVDTPAAREGRPDVKVDVTASKEIVARDASGKQTVHLVQADPSGPGDTLVYQIVYRNQGTAPAHDAQVIDPIPAGTLLVPGSWSAGNAEFAVSVDGGKTFQSYPVRRPVKAADGTTAMKDVELSAYTHVRWTSTEPLAPGATRSAAFKVTVR